MNRMNAIVAACAMELLLVSRAHAKDACEFVEIDLLDADHGWVRGLNNRGQAVGALFYDEPFYVQRPFLWHNGGTRVLPPLEEGHSSGAEAINDSGRVVGWSSSSRGHLAVTWLRGEVAELPAPEQALASTLNNRGQVAGYTLSGKCLFWPSATSAPTVLPGLGGTSCYANAISESGAIVGVAETAEGEFHAFVWHDGSMRDASPASNGGSELSDVNAFGMAVGRASTSTGPGMMVRSGGVSRVFPVAASAEAVNVWGAIALLEFTVERDETRLFIGDRFGRVRARGTLGGDVPIGDLLMNDRFQLAWNPYPAEGGGLLPPHFCQLR